MTILFKGADWFEQIVNTPLTEGLVWNLIQLVKRFQRTYTDNMILYIYVAQGQQVHITARGQNFYCNKETSPR